MLHWNSLWAPTTPDGKTELETAPVWKEPWPAEQLMAWQTLGWEQMLNASHTWWALMVAAWSMPGLAAQGLATTQNLAANDDQATSPEENTTDAETKTASARRSRGNHR